MAQLPKVREVRAYVQSDKGGGAAGQGADCHDVEDEHWINGFPTPIATPMSHHSRYSRTGRKAWGINALGSVVVEMEAENGATGVGACSHGCPCTAPARLHVLSCKGLSVVSYRRVHRRAPGLLCH